MNLYWTSTLIAEIINAKNTLESIPVSSFSIDSRTLEKNSCFIALKGENHDGHLFIKQALEKGANLIISSQYDEELIQKYGQKFLFVEDTYEALVAIAKYARAIYSGIVIGITGSSGKTTTKEVLHSLLSTDLDCYANKGNFNNQYGLPLTLCNIPLDSKICLLEMGISHPGDMSLLSEIARPDIAIITTIGTAHIGNFDNQQSLIYEKGMITSGMCKNSDVIFEGDKPYSDFISRLCDERSLNKITFGTKNSIVTYHINEANDLDIYIENSKDFMIPMPTLQGIHIPRLMTICYAVYHKLKLPKNSFKEVIEKLSPPKGRGNIESLYFKGAPQITIIDESYNANLDSMKLAIKNAEIHTTGHKRLILVLGDMLDLGKFSDKMHHELGDFILKSNVACIFFIGNQIKTTYLKCKNNIDSFHFSSQKEAFIKLSQIIEYGDIILFKGSNGMALFELKDKILNCLNKRKNKLESQAHAL